MTPEAGNDQPTLSISEIIALLERDQTPMQKVLRDLLNLHLPNHLNVGGHAQILGGRIRTEQDLMQWMRDTLAEVNDAVDSLGRAMREFRQGRN